MGAKVGGNKGGAMGDINVTPLVDVVLVLLIIFMVVTPMLSSGVEVKLPKAKTTTQAQDNGQHLVVSVRAMRVGVELLHRLPHRAARDPERPRRRRLVEGVRGQRAQQRLVVDGPRAHRQRV